MRKFILLTFCFVALHACAQEKSAYTIQGRIDHYNAPAIIYLQYMENDQIVSASSPLKNGQFSFSGHIGEPANGKLVLIPTGEPIHNNRSYPQTLHLIVVNETMEVNSPDVLQNATVDGSKTNTEYQSITESITDVNYRMDALMQEYQNAPAETLNNPQYISTIKTRYEDLKAEEWTTFLSFVKNHPDSYVSLMILQDMSRQTDNISLADTLFQGLTPEIQNTQTGKALAAQLHSSKVTAIGSVAPDFMLYDPNNQAVHLSDFRGKYLLIDFWASWCMPCRKENPNLVRNYLLYKNKNFEILGVSLDGPGEKSAWVNAIEKDKLTWPQVSDLQGWQNSVAQQYTISRIPQNLLLDPNGVIIAKNLRGEDLSLTLAKLFN